MVYVKGAVFLHRECAIFIFGVEVHVKHVSLIIRFLIPFALMSCGGEITQSESDCNDNEYFDRGDSLCKTCPAVEDLDCPTECGYELNQNELGCPVSQCVVVCEG